MEKGEKDTSKRLYKTIDEKFWSFQQQFFLEKDFGGTSRQMN